MTVPDRCDRRGEGDYEWPEHDDDDSDGLRAVWDLDVKGGVL